MKVIKQITVIVTKNIDGEFYEKKIAFDSFKKFEKYLCSTPDLKYFKVQIWWVEEPDSLPDLI